MNARTATRTIASAIVALFSLLALTPVYAQEGPILQPGQVGLGILPDRSGIVFAERHAGNSPLFDLTGGDYTFRWFTSGRATNTVYCGAWLHGVLADRRAYNVLLLNEVVNAADTGVSYLYGVPAGRYYYSVFDCGSSYALILGFGLPGETPPAVDETPPQPPSDAPPTDDAPPMDNNG